MKFIVTEDYEAMSRTAARVISGYVSSHPDCVLGLATGSTPIGLYRCLVEDYEAGALSFKDVTSFNLDEYRGLDPQHDQSYRYFMEHNLFSHVDIDPARTHVPDGACPDAAAACAAYEQSIAEAGGLGLQLLGLGHNGHIGFNEPAPEFPKETHCVELTESTINANSRLFDSIDDVPREAYTMGIGSLRPGGQGDPRGRQRLRQGRYRSPRFLRAGHSRGARLHPAVPSERHRCGG